MNTNEEIRDWYAGQALTGLLSDGFPDSKPAAARAAFDYAEAMMVEREKRNAAAIHVASMTEREKQNAATPDSTL